MIRNFFNIAKRHDVDHGEPLTAEPAVEERQDVPISEPVEYGLNPSDPGITSSPRRAQRFSQTVLSHQVATRGPIQLSLTSSASQKGWGARAPIQKSHRPIGRFASSSLSDRGAKPNMAISGWDGYSPAWLKSRPVDTQADDGRPSTEAFNATGNGAEAVQRPQPARENVVESRKSGFAHRVGQLVDQTQKLIGRTKAEPQPTGPATKAHGERSTFIDQSPQPYSDGTISSSPAVPSAAVDGVPGVARAEAPRQAGALVTDRSSEPKAQLFRDAKLDPSPASNQSDSLGRSNALPLVNDRIFPLTKQTSQLSSAASVVPPKNPMTDNWLSSRGDKSLTTPSKYQLARSSIENQPASAAEGLLPPTSGDSSGLTFRSVSHQENTRQESGVDSASSIPPHAIPVYSRVETAPRYDAVSGDVSDASTASATPITGGSKNATSQRVGKVISRVKGLVRRKPASDGARVAAKGASAVRRESSSQSQDSTYSLQRASESTVSPRSASSGSRAVGKFSVALRHQAGALRAKALVLRQKSSESGSGNEMVPPAVGASEGGHSHTRSLQPQSVASAAEFAASQAVKPSLTQGRGEELRPDLGPPSGQMRDSSSAPEADEVGVFQRARQLAWQARQMVWRKNSPSNSSSGSAIDGSGTDYASSQSPSISRANAPSSPAAKPSAAPSASHLSQGTNPANRPTMHREQPSVQRAGLNVSRSTIGTTSGNFVPVSNSSKQLGNSILNASSQGQFVFRTAMKPQVPTSVSQPQTDVKAGLNMGSQSRSLLTLGRGSSINSHRAEPIGRQNVDRPVGNSNGGPIRAMIARVVGPHGAASLKDLAQTRVEATSERIPAEPMRSAEHPGRREIANSPPAEKATLVHRSTERDSQTLGTEGNELILGPGIPKASGYLQEQRPGMFSHSSSSQIATQEHSLGSSPMISRKTLGRPSRISPVLKNVSGAISQNRPLTSPTVNMSVVTRAATGDGLFANEAARSADLQPEGNHLQMLELHNPTIPAGTLPLARSNGPQMNARLQQTSESFQNSSSAVDGRGFPIAPNQQSGQVNRILPRLPNGDQGVINPAQISKGGTPPTPPTISRSEPLTASAPMPERNAAVEGSEHKQTLDAGEIEFIAAKVYSYLKEKLVIEKERHGRPSYLP